MGCYLSFIDYRLNKFPESFWRKLSPIPLFTSNLDYIFYKSFYLFIFYYEMSVLSRNLFSCAFSSYSQRSFTRILTPSNSRLYVRRFVSNQDDTSNFNYRPLITNIKTPNFRKEEKIIRSPKSPHDVGVQKKKREMEETIIEKCMVSSNNYKKALKFVFRLEISMVPLRKL